MYAPSSAVLTLTVEVAMLSVNKIEMMDDKLNVNTKFYIVSTLTVEVGRLSVNKKKMMDGNVYTKFYSVDTSGYSSNA